MGAENNMIQKIFLYNGVSIMSQGMLWGNLIGLTFFLHKNIWDGFDWILLPIM